MGYDAVVVGGGPAGASTALFLARKGAKVLLIEKKKLPRSKLCAGCISARLISLLPEGWESEVLNTIKGGYLGFKGERFYHRTFSEPVAFIIERSSFDHFLVRSAIKEGAELWEKSEFLKFEEGRKLRVKTVRGTVETDFLIGADGFYTKVGKELGYVKRRFFRSIEFWTEGKLREEVIIDIGLVRRGYGWIFPRGDMVSVGLATTGRENTLKVLKDYVRRHRFLKSKEVRGVKGWMIPFATRREDLHLGRGKVLLVGDAASMVDPLLGEGIYYGILGGRLLAEALAQNPGRAHEEYRRRIEAEILPELHYAGRIARLAYNFQGVAFGMGGGQSIERLLNLLLGRVSYKEVYRKGLVEFVMSFLSFENFLHIIMDKILRRR